MAMVLDTVFCMCCTLDQQVWALTQNPPTTIQHTVHG